MRIAHLSDLHLTEGPRLDDQVDVLARVLEQLEQLEPDLVLLSGDLYGTTVPHRSTPRERQALFPWMRAVADLAPVVVVQGNHDDPRDLQGLEHLAGAWSIAVSTTATAFEVATRAGVAHLYTLPYPTKRWILSGERPSGVAETQAAIEQRLDVLLRLWATRIRTKRKARPGEPHVLVGHLQIRGSTVGAGVVLAGQEIELTRDQVDGLQVDYGALGHLHDAQDAGERCRYAGSLWNTAHSSTALPSRGWTLVDVGEVGRARRAPPGGFMLPRADPGLELIRVAHVASGCRPFVTVEYRWSQDHGSKPRWTRNPFDPDVHSDPDSRACHLRGERTSYELSIAGAEVRARLTVPAQHVATCPWDAELERLEQLGAHRVIAERVIEPVLRVRAPEVAAARDLPDKVRAYWRTLATTPTDDEQGAALEVLDELRDDHDTEIEQRSDALLA